MRANREQIIEALLAGALVALPTESSFALAGRIDSQTAMDKLFELKAERNKPVGLMIAHPRLLPGYVQDVTPVALDLVRAYWPGPLTLVFDATGHIPEALTAGTGSIGIRQPGLEELLPILEAVQVPVTATSANLPGEAPILTITELEQVFPELLVWDAFEVLPGGAPSTVVDIRSGWYEVLRQGAIDL